MPRIAQQLSHFTARELSLLFKKARRVLTHPGLHILLAPASLEFGRILVVTSRKVGTAPVRNKVRRRLKAIFYQEQFFDKKLDCIVIIKPNGASYDFSHLKHLLSSTLERNAFMATP